MFSVHILISSAFQVKDQAIYFKRVFQTRADTQLLWLRYKSFMEREAFWLILRDMQMITSAGCMFTMQ